jgi:hypothetical protein
MMIRKLFFRKKLVQRENLMENSNLLSKYFESDNFKSGKRFFLLNNFGEFKLLDELRDLKELKKGTLWGKTFAKSSTFDGDDLYILYIGFNIQKNECGIFIYNGEYVLPSQELTHLKEPIRVGESIKDLFGTENIGDILQEEYAFEDSITKAYHSSELRDESIVGYIPQKDLRVLFKEEYPDSVIVYHEEYNSKRLNYFFSEAKINVDEEFTCFPQRDDYYKLVQKANSILGRQEYYYVSFCNSGFHGLGKKSSLDNYQVLELFRLGIFYDMSQQDKELYDLNNKSA